MNGTNCPNMNTFQVDQISALYRKIENCVIIFSLKGKTMGKMINRIPGLILLNSTLKMS